MPRAGAGVFAPRSRVRGRSPVLRYMPGAPRPDHPGGDRALVPASRQASLSLKDIEKRHQKDDEGDSQQYRGRNRADRAPQGKKTRRVRPQREMPPSLHRGCTHPGSWQRIKKKRLSERVGSRAVHRSLSRNRSLFCASVDHQRSRHERHTPD